MDLEHDPGALGTWPHDRALHAYWVEPWLLAGEYPGNASPDVARQRLQLLVDHGIRTFVDLTTPADGLPPYAAVLDEIAQQRSIALTREAHPIPDFGVLDDAGYDAILAAVDRGATRGGVYLHCWGGVGRTGTVVGCHLVRAGVTLDSALTRLTGLRASSRMAHRTSPETTDQVDVLRRRAQR